MRRNPATAALATAAAILLGAGAAAAQAPPATSGGAALVMDVRSGHVMHAVRGSEQRPVASTTKLMTALLTLERAELDDVFPAARYAAAPVESKINLRPGERMTVRDLLVALLLESANDAAVTLAENIGGSREAFVREMNRRAVSLGLRDTSYANPIGFDDPENHSSARDLAKLTRILMRNERFARIVDLPEATLRSGARTRLIDNRNRLVANYPFVSGVKTGRTSGAGYVLVGAGEKPGARVLSVTLGAPSESARDADTLALLRWGLAQFKRRVVVRARSVLARVDVRHQDEDAELAAARGVALVLRDGERTRTVLDRPDSLEGPLDAGEAVGSVEVRRRGRTVRRVPLVTLEAIPEAGFLARLSSGSAGMMILTLLFALGIVASAILLVTRRGRAR